MNYRGYPERDLVANRSSLLLYGSTEAERRAWAEEAWWNFANEGPLRIATTAAELKTALGVPRGVLYVPDVGALDDGAQSELVHLLREREERPKLILGVTGAPDRARDAGRLRSDLQYALQMAQVNLDEPGLKEAIRSRRAKAPKRPPAQVATFAPTSGPSAPPRFAAAPSSTSQASASAASRASNKRAAPAKSNKKSAAAKDRRTASSRSSAPRAAARRAPKPAAKKKSRAPARKSASPRRRR